MQNLSDLLQVIKSKKVFIKVFSSSSLGLPISLLISFVTYRLIDPYYIGIWAAVTLVESYAPITRLGIINGMNIELPFASGKGRSDDAKKYAQTTLFYTICIIVLLIVVFPFFIVFNIELNKIYIAALVIVLLRIITITYTSYLMATFRSTNHFNILSNIQFVVLGLKPILIGLVFLWGFSGYLIMQLVIPLVQVVLLYIYRPFRILPRLYLDSFKKLFKVGFPVFLSSYMSGLISTIPRLFILKFSDTFHLGLYSPVLLVITTFAVFPTALSTYFYPRFSFILGKDKDPMILYRKMMKLIIYTFLIILPFVVIGYFLVDMVIEFFPKYQQSASYLKIIILSGPFILANLGGMLSAVLKQPKLLLIYVFFNGLFSISYLYIFYNFVSEDVLFCAAWSQVLTLLSLFIISFIININAVKLYARKTK
jgi:O-antigen/teichoic acid export membrane protein